MMMSIAQLRALYDKNNTAIEAADALEAKDDEIQNLENRLRVALDAIKENTARIAELEALLKECADDLAAELDGRDRIMPDNKVHPAMQHRYDRDMAPVRAARAALGEKE